MYLHIDMIYLEVQLLFGGRGGFQSTVIVFRTMYFLELLFQLVSDFQGVWLWWYFYHRGLGDISSCLTHLNHILSCWANWCWSLICESAPPVFLGGPLFSGCKWCGVRWKGLKKLCSYNISWFQSHMASNPSRQLLPKLKPNFVAVEQKAHEHLQTKKESIFYIVF